MTERARVIVVADDLIWSSRLVEAVRRAEKALALSPLDRFSFRYDTALCLAHYTNGSFDEAVRWGMRAIDAAPGYTAAIRFAIAACAASGRSGQARELARKLLDAQPDFRVRGVREIGRAHV